MAKYIINNKSRGFFNKLNIDKNKSSKTSQVTDIIRDFHNAKPGGIISPFY